MNFRQHLVNQFGHPRGPFGWVVGRIMARRRSNVERTLATVELLGLGPGDEVLELGHGPGVGLERALEVVGDGRVVGLERSSAMSAMARRRNRSAVRSGRLRLVVADAERPPDDIGDFDAIFSSNVWMFWADPVATLAAWRPHLRPGGAMAVTFRPPHPQADSSEAFEAGARIVRDLEAAGYDDIRLEAVDIDGVPAMCGIGVLAGDAPDSAARPFAERDRHLSGSPLGEGVAFVAPDRP